MRRTDSRPSKTHPRGTLVLQIARPPLPLPLVRPLAHFRKRYAPRSTGRHWLHVLHFWSMGGLAIVQWAQVHQPTGTASETTLALELVLARAFALPFAFP